MKKSLRNAAHKSIISFLMFAIVIAPSLTPLHFSGFSLSAFLGGDLSQISLEKNEAQAAPIGPGGVDDAGLTLWLDASDASTLFTDQACATAATDGDDIGCWQDLSGQANHVTGTAEPTYNINQQNSLPTLDFDGDRLTTPDADQITNQSSYTKFVVYSQDTTTGNQNLVSSSTTDSHALLAPGGELWTWNGGVFLESSALPANNYYVGSTRYAAPDGGTNILNIDGAQVDSNATLQNLTAVTPTQIGNHDVVDNGLDGQIAEAIVFDRALTDAEIDDVECYLGEKWGIAVSSTCYDAIYDFESDTIGNTPANITIANGVINTVTGQEALPVSVSGGNTAVFNLDSFTAATDYSVTWKQNYTTARRTGVILRGTGLNTTNAGARQGYLFQTNPSSNDVRIYRSNAGSYTQLTPTVALTAPGAGVDRWYKATADGSTLTLAYSDDGVSFTDIIVRTDATYAGSGLSQLVQGYGVGVGGAPVDDITFINNDPVVISDGIDVTSVSEYQVFQRDGSDEADIAISGTYTGTPTAIEASFNGGAYVTIDAAPSGGTFSTTLVDQTVGQGTLSVRFTNDTAIAEDIDNVGVGDIFVIAGQSNNSGRGNTLNTYSHATLKAGLFGNDDNWKELSDAVDSNAGQVDSVSSDNASGSQWPLVATDILANHNVPVAFVPTAKGGTRTNQWQPSVATTTLYGSMSRRIAAVGGDIAGVLWFQGESNASNGTTEATYETELGAIVDAISTDFGGAKTLVGQIGHSNSAGNDIIRKAQVDVVNSNANALLGPAAYDIDLSDGDTLHFKTDADMAEFADRWYAAIDAEFYGGSDGYGPILDSANLTYDTAANVVTVPFDEALAAGSTATADSFDLQNNGSSVGISNVVIVGSTVEITPTTALDTAQTMTLTYASLNDGVNEAIYDNNDLPAQPFYAQMIVASTPVTAPGGVSGSLELWLKADGDLGNYNDGDPVTTATEFSSNSNDGDGTGHAPVFENDTVQNINFNPVYDFNGTSQYFAHDSVLGTNAYDETTVYIVHETDTPGQGGGLFGESTAEGRFMVHSPWTNNQVLWNDNGAGSVWESYTPSPILNDRAALQTFGTSAVSGEDKYIRENGVQVDDGASLLTTSTGQNNPFNVGATGNPNAFADTSIAEIITYVGSSQQSSTDRQKIESYLALKYGITLDQSAITPYLASNSGSVWGGIKSLQEDAQTVSTAPAASRQLVTTSNPSASGFGISTSAFHLSEDPAVVGTQGQTITLQLGTPKDLYLVGASVDGPGSGQGGIEHNGTVNGIHFQATLTAAGVVYEVIDNPRHHPGPGNWATRSYDSILASETADFVLQGYDFDVLFSNFPLTLPIDSFNHDIFGIGRDDSAELGQVKSKSINADSVITIEADGEGTNAVTTFVDIADREFLTIANDNDDNGTIETQTTELTSTYDSRLDREWKVDETGDVGTVDLDFDLTGLGIAATDIITLLVDANADFSESLSQEITATSWDGTTATFDDVSVSDGEYFTVASTVASAADIEFETATASDDENTGENLPNLLIDGVLAADTDIDVTVNASSTATLGTDFEFGGLSGALPQTATITIPAGTYTSANPVPLSVEKAFDETYANLTNPPAVFPQDSFVAPATGDYTLTLSADVIDINSGNAWVNVGTTFVASGGASVGSADIFNGLANGTSDRISVGTPSQSFIISLVAGTTYHVTVGAGGGGNVDNVNVLIAKSSLDFAITGDTDIESDEIIDLTLSNPQGGLTLADVAGGSLIDNHVYTITNDDFVSPTVTVDQVSGQVDPTNVDSVQYEVVFSEAMDPATFNAADITLAGTTGTVTAGPTTADNITWSFTVTGMTSDDTAIATIAADVVTSALGGLNDASTSTDNTVLYDATPPTSTPLPTAPTPNTSVSNPTAVVGSCGVDALNGILRITSNPAGGITPEPTDLPLDVNGDYNGTVTWIPNADGSTYGLEFTCIDEAGNPGPTVEVTPLTVILTPPSAPTVSSPTPTTPPIPYPNVDINVTCEAVDDIITIYGPGITPDPTTHTCTTTGPVDIPVVVDPGGTVNLTVTATNIVGESTATPVTFTTGTATDTDGDGNSNAEEDAGFNGGDGNGDGIPDSQQQHVSAAPNPVTGDYTTLEAAGACTFITDNVLVAESALTVQDPSHDYPVGLADFEIQCPNAGDSADITIYYTQEYDTSNWDYKKYDSNGNVYADISSLVTYATADVNGTTVTTASFSLTDGDPQTDEDGLANGLINDPSGPAVTSVVPIYRFYSETYNSHFYTKSEAERDSVIADYDDSIWRYEGIAFYAYPDDAPGYLGVHRFWSATYNSHFYTTNTTEQSLITNDPNWRYEGIDWYASTTGPKVYRFYSENYRSHFYTTSITERDAIIANDPNWSLEGEVKITAL